MDTIERLRKHLDELVEKVGPRGQAKVLREHRLPKETFKGIRRGHMPSDPAVRAKLARLFGYSSTDELFGAAIDEGQSPSSDAPPHLDRSVLARCLEKYFELLDDARPDWDAKRKAAEFIDIYHRELGL